MQIHIAGKMAFIWKMGRSMFSCSGWDYGNIMLKIIYDCDTQINEFLFFVDFMES